MLIDIKNGLADVTYKKGRRTLNKTVTLSTLIEAFNQDSGISTPLLPFGTRKYIRNKDIHTLYIEFAPIQRTITYMNRSDKIIFRGKIPLPWGIFKLDFKETNGRFRLERTEIYATKRPINSPTEQLYYYPLPNIYSDQRICWGTTFVTAGFDEYVNSLNDAGKVLDIFFSSNYNTDISPRVMQFDRYEDLLRSLEDKATFNLDLLVPCKPFNEI